MPLISVIIPTYNRAWSILRALESVMEQSFDNFDVWIVDDGSSDKTREIVQEFVSRGTRVPVNYTVTTNMGVAAARNLGIQKSSGQWIALLDSDDQWVSDKLERQFKYMEAHPEISLIHSGEQWIRNGKRVNPPKAYRKFGGDVFEKCLPVCMIGPSTSIFKRVVFEDAGGFDEEYPVCEDYDFWLRVCMKETVGFIDEDLTVKYGGHEDQLSTTHVAMDYWRIRSLAGIASNTGLSTLRRTAVIEEMHRKGHILLKGYRKHGREDSYMEVLDLIHRADGGAFHPR